MSTRAGQRRQMVLAVAAVFAVLGVALIATSPEASGAPGTLPAPLGQATNAGINDLGCAGQPGNWDGFDARGYDGNDDGGEDFGPVALKIEPSGRVWVSDYRNSVTNPAEGRLYSWPSIAAAQGCTDPDLQLNGLNQPEGIAFDVAGNMYVTDTGNNRVLKFTPAQLETMTSDLGPADIKTVDPAVPDADNDKIVADRIWSGPDGTPRELHFPRGVEVGPDQRIYVADDRHDRVVIYDANDANDAVPDIISGPAFCDPKALAFSGAALFVVNFGNDGPPVCNGEQEVIRLANVQPTDAAVVTASWDVPGAIDLSAFSNGFLVTSVLGGYHRIVDVLADDGAHAGTPRELSVGQNGHGTNDYVFNGPTFGIDTISPNGNRTLVADAGNMRVVQFDLTATPGTINTIVNVESVPSPATAGAPFAITATVVPVSGEATPTGTVQFSAGGGTLGGAVTLADGVATLPLDDVDAGTYPISAAYSGSTTHNPSSGTMQLVVNPPGQKINTTTAVASSKNPATVGDALAFTATVTAASGQAKPTGTVQFQLNGANAGAPVALDANGIATITGPSAEQGTYAVTAVYSGSDAFNASTSTALSQVVNEPDDQKIDTTTAVASSKNPATAGDALAFTATVTAASGQAKPTGTVQFRLNGAAAGDPVALDANGIATLTGPNAVVGTYSVTAVYSGSDVFNASTSPTLTQVVNPVVVEKIGTTTALASSKNPAIAGDPVTYTVTVTPATGNVTPQGTVQFQLNGTDVGNPVALNANGVAVLPTAAAVQGTHVIGAVYSGSDAFNPSTGTITQVVNPAVVVKVGTTTALTSSKNPASAGDDVTFTATVAPASGTVTPTGTVQFRVNGQDVGAPRALNANGVATVSTPDAIVGTYAITAVYSGSAAFNSSIGTLQQVVNAPSGKIATSTAVTVAPEPTLAGEQAVLTATITPASGRAVPTGTVQFQVDGFNVGQPAAVNAQGRASIVTDSLSAGPHTIRATYSGSRTHLGSSGVRQIITGKGPDAGGTTLRLTPAQAERGDTILVEGFGWPAHATVTITLESDPVLLAIVTAGANGRFREAVTIPANTPLGNHLIVTTGSGRRSSARLEVVATDRRAPATTTTTAAPGRVTTTSRPVLVADDFGLTPETTARRTTSSTLPKTGAGLASQTNAGIALLLIGAMLVLATERQRIVAVPVRRRR